MVRHSPQHKERSHSLSSFRVEENDKLSRRQEDDVLLQQDEEEDPAYEIPRSGGSSSSDSVNHNHKRKSPRKKARSKSLTTTLEPTDEWLDVGDEIIHPKSPRHNRNRKTHTKTPGRKERSLSPRRRLQQNNQNKEGAPTSRKRRSKFIYPERTFTVQFNPSIHFIPHPNGIYASVNPSKLYYHKREIAQFKQQHKDDFRQFREKQDPQDFVFFQLFWHCQDRAQEHHHHQQQQHDDNKLVSMDPQLLQKVRNALKHSPHKIGLERFFFKATSKDKFRRRRSVWELLQEIQDRDFSNPIWRERLLQGTCAQLSAGSVLFAQYIAWGASGYHMVHDHDHHHDDEEDATLADGY